MNNVLGYVTEYTENRSVETDPEVPVETVVRLKLKLTNTLGKEREIWVQGPADLSDFFGA